MDFGFGQCLNQKDMLIRNFIKNNEADSKKNYLEPTITLLRNMAEMCDSGFGMSEKNQHGDNTYDNDAEYQVIMQNGVPIMVANAKSLCAYEIALSSTPGTIKQKLLNNITLVSTPGATTSATVYRRGCVTGSPLIKLTSYSVMDVLGCETVCSLVACGLDTDNKFIPMIQSLDMANFDQGALRSNVDLLTFINGVTKYMFNLTSFFKNAIANTSGGDTYILLGPEAGEVDYINVCQLANGVTSDPVYAKVMSRECGVSAGVNKLSFFELSYDKAQSAYSYEMQVPMTMPYGTPFETQETELFNGTIHSLICASIDAVCNVPLTKHITLRDLLTIEKSSALYSYMMCHPTEVMTMLVDHHKGNGSVYCLLSNVLQDTNI